MLRDFTVSFGFRYNLESHEISEFHFPELKIHGNLKSFSFFGRLITADAKATTSKRFL